jgi:FkbM family methyltransferase
MHGAYEAEVWDALSSCAVAREIVWDVGANVGSFAILAARHPRVAEVHAFEPDPLNRQILEINNSLNGGRFRIHSIALSDRVDGARIFHGPPTNTGMSTLVPANMSAKPSFLVECTTVDRLVFIERLLPPPTLMKIDVEGWESFVFKGAERLLAELPPRAIVFEAELEFAEHTIDQEVPAMLERAGYTVDHIPRRNDTLKARENYLARRQ